MLAKRTACSPRFDAGSSPDREAEGVPTFGSASEGDLEDSGAISNGCATWSRTVWSVASRTAQAQPLSGSSKPESRSSSLITISALKSERHPWRKREREAARKAGDRAEGHMPDDVAGCHHFQWKRKTRP